MTLEVELPRVAVNGKVFLDGTEISHIVRAIRIEAVVGELTKVELEILPKHVIIHAIDPEIHAQVAALGSGITETTSLADPVRAFIKHVSSAAE